MVEALCGASGEHGFRAADADFLLRDADLGEEQTGVGLAQFGWAFVEVLAQGEREAFDLVLGDLGLGRIEAAGKIANFGGQLVAAEPEGDHALAHGRIMRIHQPLLDQVQQAGKACLGFAVIVAQLLELAAVAVFPFKRRAQVIFQQMPEVLRVKDALDDLGHDQAVELVHRHAQADAGQRALLQAARTAVIAILPALAGVLDEGGSAVPATGDPG
ncbi:MAG: hypothetical protein PHE36_06740 [Novosphingobium sp.]|nr:hypothetical protein [Novosphingobium sp.]